MDQFSARYFAGDRPVGEDVVVRVGPDDGYVTLTGAGFTRSFAVEALHLEERIGGSPRVIELPNGGRLECADHDAIEDLANIFGEGGGWLHALESRRGPVLGALFAVVLLLAGFVWQGLPALAWMGARVLPPSYDQRIGAAALAFLDRKWLSPSELSDQERARVSGLFTHVIEHTNTQRELQLLFRAGHPQGEEQGIGANALALPSGVVVITDEMVALAATDDELAGVLAHEVGHVVHRHSLRGVIQNTGITVLVGVLTGDAAGMNVLVEAAPAILANAAYSRRFETAADDFASEYLVAAGRDPSALGTLLLRLEEEHGGAASMGYLSSHPPAARRAARGAARAQGD